MWVCSVFGRQDAINELFKCVFGSFSAFHKRKRRPWCGPPLLLSEGLFCAFGWLIPDGYGLKN